MPTPSSSRSPPAVTNGSTAITSAPGRTGLRTSRAPSRHAPAPSSSSTPAATAHRRPPSRAPTRPPRGATRLGACDRYARPTYTPAPTTNPTASAAPEARIPGVEIPNRSSTWSNRNDALAYTTAARMTVWPRRRRKADSMRSASPMAAPSRWRRAQPESARSRYRRGAGRRNLRDSSR